MKTNKELKEFNTQIELLNDTIQYYWGKPERKSSNDIGLCSYYPGKNEINHTNANRMPLRVHENIAVFYKKLPTYNPQYSCTTGIACINTNRNFIGIENNMDYFNISLKRVEEKRKEKDFNVLTSFGDGM